ncbi:hypothetical protein V1508DRAFT_406998 [Lipomyces doorenjongii]|uniref:uncharacterized protein n=1 Tax=Lipomyces doorenjongii TaxID=383834 RepID=UPI0034CF9283
MAREVTEILEDILYRLLISLGGTSWDCTFLTNPTFTKTTFLDSLDVLIIHDLPLRVYKINDGREHIQRTQDPLLPGEYETYYKRTSSAMSSLSASGRVRSLPAAVRDRDRGCVITGRWTGYDAAHVFPVALESMFHNYNSGELVVLDERDGSVNSPQNGLLLQTNVHHRFDQYEISINANDDYRIVCFLDDSLGLAGRQLDPICRDLEDPHHQAVLANMRGAGEPRMEFELSSRLGDVMQAQGSLLIK